MLKTYSLGEEVKLRGVITGFSNLAYEDIRYIVKIKGSDYSSVEIYGDFLEKEESKEKNLEEKKLKRGNLIKIKGCVGQYRVVGVMCGGTFYYMLVNTEDGGVLERGKGNLRELEDFLKNRRYEWELVTPEPQLSGEELVNLYNEYCADSKCQEGCEISDLGEDGCSIECALEHYDTIVEILTKYKEERDKEIKVGDLVKVIDDGKTCTTYREFVKKHCTEEEKLLWSPRSTPNENSVYKVTKIEEGDIAYIKQMDGAKGSKDAYFPVGYVIGLHGLEKIK
jgi:hypothetical protein